MWPHEISPGLTMDLYELTMAQIYHNRAMTEKAYFEVFIRTLPKDWGFFVMAGLEEVYAYLEAFRFSSDDIDFLRTTGFFENEFLDYLKDFRPRVSLRGLPEGTVCFPDEPLLEVGGPLMDAQILETGILNILNFSIIAATLAARVVTAARGRPVIEFGLRRAHSPLSALRAARAAQLAGFAATSNLAACRLLHFKPTGTMAHSYIEVHDSEASAFDRFICQYRDQTILLIDTYDPQEGIRSAAAAALKFYHEEGIRIKGIRLDSGDVVALSRFARAWFRQTGTDFLDIYASSGLDEYKIAALLDAGAEIDGFGIGTRFAVSHHAPDIDIVYKIVQYHNKPLFKTSPDKQTRPGRKTLLRIKNRVYTEDLIVPFSGSKDDLLKPVDAPETAECIKTRLRSELQALPPSLKRIQNPGSYPVKYSRLP